MSLGLILASLALAAVAAAGVWVRRQFAELRGIERQISAIAAAHGYAPSGAQDGVYGDGALTFRSASCWLKVERYRGYAHVALAPRGEDMEWIDDDLLRQVLLGEEGHPEGVRREWRDDDALVRFLRDRLAEMEAAVTSPDPAMRGALAEAQAKRAARAQRWWESMKAQPRGDTAGGRE